MKDASAQNMVDFSAMYPRAVMEQAMGQADSTKYKHMGTKNAEENIPDSCAGTSNPMEAPTVAPGSDQVNSTPQRPINGPYMQDSNGHMADPSYMHLGSPQYQYMYQPQGADKATVTPHASIPPAYAPHLAPQGHPQPATSGNPMNQVPFHPHYFNQVPTYAPTGQMMAPAWQGLQPEPSKSSEYYTPVNGSSYMQSPLASTAGVPGPASQPFTQATAHPAFSAQKSGSCNCHQGADNHHTTNTTQDFAQNIGQIFGANGFFPGGNMFGNAFAGIPGLDHATFAQQANEQEAKHQQPHYGQMFELYSDLMQGKTDPAKIAGFLSSSGGNFWKGAIVGALLTFIMTNSSVKSTLAESFSTIFGSAKPE